MNTRKFAEVVFDILRNAGYHPSLIMGGEMSTQERDEQIEKFRLGKVQVVITTDLLARGFDMPTTQLAINFDVPIRNREPEPETYLHRIGRAGRFGTPGIAVTLFDREEDEAAFWEIIKFFNMKDKVQNLDGGAEQVGTLLDGLKQDDA